MTGAGNFPAPVYFWAEDGQAIAKMFIKFKQQICSLNCLYLAGAGCVCAFWPNIRVWIP
jgi:hypothetical protein